MGLIKSLVVWVKNIIVNALLRLFNENVLPLLKNVNLLLISERTQYWLNILYTAYRFLYASHNLFSNTKALGFIDNVNYADIVVENNQNTPESTAIC